MLLREDRSGASLLVIGQPAHAALAGVLARRWDDDLTPALVRATSHHDDVWTAWDARPRLNQATGRPVAFTDLAPAERVAVWSRASELAAPLGPEAELWVLRHALRLHRDAADPGLQTMVEAITARAAVLVDALRAAHPVGFDDLALARGTALLSLWDALSLRLCSGVSQPVDAGVLRLAPAGDDAVAVAPWPFTASRVEASVWARRLPLALDGQPALDAAWAAASPEAIAIVLVRG